MRNLAAFALLALPWLYFEAAAAGPALRSAVGTNLDPVVHYSPQIPFADVMKSAAPWGSSDGKPLDLGPDGELRSLAPGQVARTLMLREFGDRYPSGRYLVRYKGEGTLVFRFAAKVVSQRPGEIVLEVKPEAGGIYLHIERTNPSNPVRQIRITLPGGICEGEPFRHAPSAAQCKGRKYRAFADSEEPILFNPQFLDRLRGYSVLRFMDWMRTNNSTAARWSERPHVEDAMWSGDAGAPVEVMVALANATGAHPWFTVPHLADDAWVEAFATRVQALLRPDLAVYVEHSNEVWNGMFAQQRYALQQGKARRPALDGVEYHADRTRAIGAIFSRVLGVQRTVIVLGAQAGNPWTATHALDYLRKAAGNGRLGVDSVAIAPYLGFGPDPANAPRVAATPPEALFRQLKEDDLPKAMDLVRQYRRIADAHGLALFAYEGGQHLSGVAGAENHEPLNALYDAVNRDPRIRALYLDYLDAWKRAGGELFVHYTDVGRYTKWGRWGALEYIAQPREQAPKFDALQTFIERNPPWWGARR